MNELYEYDENNEILPSGKTYFTSIDQSIKNIDQVIYISIEHGTYPNFPDSNGVYPIEYASFSSKYFFFLKFNDLFKWHWHVYKCIKEFY